MPEFLKYHPEARFAHYLMMVAALGEGTVTAPARAFSEYENSVGTGQMHLWFDRPRRLAGLEAVSGRNTAGSCSTARSVQVRRDGDELVAGDGRRVRPTTPIHLPPVEPTKIIAVHLNHRSRVPEFQAQAAPRADLLPQADLRARSATAARWSGPRTASTSTTRARSRS